MRLYIQWGLCIISLYTVLGGKMKTNKPLTVVPFPELKGDYVVERAKEALDIIEKENIANCAVIMVTHDGSVITGWANSDKPFVMLGGLHYLMSEFSESTIER